MDRDSKSRSEFRTQRHIGLASKTDGDDRASFDAMIDQHGLV